MDNWEIKLKERSQATRLQPAESGIYRHGPRQARIRPRASSRLKSYKALALASEAVFVLVHFFLNKEAIDTAGIEINEYFVDSVLFGWMFQAMPKLTAVEPISAITALFFVAVAIAAWWNLLEDKPIATLRDRVVRGFLLGTYLFVIAGEAMLVLHRVSLGQNAFVSSGTEPVIAFFIASLFVLANSAAAFFTASVYLQDRRERNA